MKRRLLVGQTVLITGAARGIGAETARRVVGLGANAMLVGLEAERLSALADELGEDRVAWAEADIVDETALADAVATARSRFGRLDIAIANAGLHFAGTVTSTPTEQLLREIGVNLSGTLLTDRAVMPALTESGGYLLNIASLAASAHLPMMGSYSASKAGVEAATDCLRAEVAHLGVDVGCAYLGFFDTDLVRGNFTDPSARSLKGVVPSFVSRPRPLTEAVTAIVDGVMRRRRRIWAPRYVGGAIALRGLLQPASDMFVVRSRAVAAGARMQSSETITDREQLLGVAARLDRRPAPDAP
jgi:NAD(P)-dependent dehydrogenase (short-subunit alcohol dehydrogenase family)